MTTQPASAPQDRALAAAEALDAEGQRVTARAVKDRARVQMETARAAAADWNTRKAQQAATPDPPESFTIRFNAIWGDAYRTAKAKFEAEREGWTTRLDDAEAEVDALQGDIVTTEQQRDQARTELEHHTAATEQLKQARAEAEKTHIRTPATLDAITAERNQLRADLTEEREAWTTRLDHAEQEVDALQADIVDAERQRDQARAELERHTAATEQLTQALAEAEKSQIRTQATLDAVTAERNQLRADLTEERERHAAAEARHHQAMLDLVAAERDQSPTGAPSKRR